MGVVGVPVRVGVGEGLGVGVGVDIGVGVGEGSGVAVGVGEGLKDGVEALGEGAGVVGMRDQKVALGPVAVGPFGQRNQ